VRICEKSVSTGMQTVPNICNAFGIFGKCYYLVFIIYFHWQARSHVIEQTQREIQYEKIKTSITIVSFCSRTDFLSQNSRKRPRKKGRGPSFGLGSEWAFSYVRD